MAMCLSCTVLHLTNWGFAAWQERERKAQQAADVAAAAQADAEAKLAEATANCEQVANDIAKCDASIASGKELVEGLKKQLQSAKEAGAAQSTNDDVVPRLPQCRGFGAETDRICATHLHRTLMWQSSSRRQRER